MHQHVPHMQSPLTAQVQLRQASQLTQRRCKRRRARIANLVPCSHHAQRPHHDMSQPTQHTPLEHSAPATVRACVHPTLLDVSLLAATRRSRTPEIQPRQVSQLKQCWCKRRRARIANLAVCFHHAAQHTTTKSTRSLRERSVPMTRHVCNSRLHGAAALHRHAHSRQRSRCVKPLSSRSAGARDAAPASPILLSAHTTRHARTTT